MTWSLDLANAASTLQQLRVALLRIRFRAGPALYRWRVNRLLVRHNLAVRLAEDGEDGEDQGRLMRLVDLPRSELLQRALASPTAQHGVAHAVSLFRVREATGEQKRSAVVALARILEDRKALLKNGMLSGDESDLREVAPQPVRTTTQTRRSEN